MQSVHFQVRCPTLQVTVFKRYILTFSFKSLYHKMHWKARSSWWITNCLYIFTISTGNIVSINKVSGNSWHNASKTTRSIRLALFGLNTKGCGRIFRFYHCRLFNQGHIVISCRFIHEVHCTPCFAIKHLFRAISLDTCKTLLVSLEAFRTITWPLSSRFIVSWNIPSTGSLQSIKIFQLLLQIIYLNFGQKLFSPTELWSNFP